MRIFTILSLSIVALSLGACNTIEGFGKDVEKAGEKIQQI